MTRPAPDRATSFIRARESCRLTAYQDDGGVWTCGWGSTRGVTPTTVWTQAQADAAFAADVQVAATELEAKIGRPAVDRLTEPQYAAMLSFVFNLGTPGTTIWALLKSGKLGGVPAQMLLFDHVRDRRTGQLVESKGLKNRRLAEIALWDDAGDAAAPPSGYTRAADTPPSPGAPLRKSKSFVVTAAGACATCAGAVYDYVQPAADGVRAAADKIAPMADGSPHVAQIHSLMLTVACGLTLAGVVCVAISHRRAAG